MAKFSIYVVDKDKKVPFLRGMLTHSLIEKGLTFKDAYKTANLVRDRIRDKGTISRKKLRNVISTVLEDEFGDRYQLTKEKVAPPPAVMVRGEQTVPFSKGILSQSLQASGLEPQEGYKIAVEIEQSLLQRQPMEVSRDELRGLVYRTLQENQSLELAERYLLWRYFRAPDKPVIILFGGATGVGKTTVATEVAHRLGIGKILTTDTIRQIMRMMISRDLLPAIHSSSFDAWRELQPLPEEQSQLVLTAFKEQATRVLVGVRAMIARSIEENTSTIIDGVHLVPGLMDFGRKTEKQAYIVPVVVSTLNPNDYLERFPSRQFQASERPAWRYRENFESILQIQDYILEMAEAHDVPIVENRNLDQTVTSVLSVVTNSLREKLDINSEELVAKAL